MCLWLRPKSSLSLHKQSSLYIWKSNFNLTLNLTLNTYFTPNLCACDWDPSRRCLFINNHHFVFENQTHILSVSHIVWYISILIRSDYIYLDWQLYNFFRLPDLSLVIRDALLYRFGTFFDTVQKVFGGGGSKTL